MGDKVKLNEKEITREELEKKKEEIANMSGARIVEVRPGEFKIRLYD